MRRLTVFRKSFELDDENVGEAVHVHFLVAVSVLLTSSAVDLVVADKKFFVVELSDAVIERDHSFLFFSFGFYFDMQLAEVDVAVADHEKLEAVCVFT